MEMADIFMLLMFVLGGASALFMVTSRNVVHSALSLVVVMLAVAGTFLLGVDQVSILKQRLSVWTEAGCDCSRGSTSSGSRRT